MLVWRERLAVVERPAGAIRDAKDCVYVASGPPGAEAKVYGVRQPKDSPVAACKSMLASRIRANASSRSSTSGRGLSVFSQGATRIIDEDLQPPTCRVMRHVNGAQKPPARTRLRNIQCPTVIRTKAI